jgi:hypothetical protein
VDLTDFLIVASPGFHPSLGIPLIITLHKDLRDQHARDQSFHPSLGIPLIITQI